LARRSGSQVHGTNRLVRCTSLGFSISIELICPISIVFLKSRTDWIARILNSTRRADRKARARQADDSNVF